MKSLICSFTLFCLSFIPLLAQAQTRVFKCDEVSITLQKVTDNALQVKFKNDSDKTNIFRYILTVERPVMLEYDFVDGGNDWGPTLKPNESFSIQAYLKHPLQEGEVVKIWMLNERYEVIAEETLLTYED